MLQLQPPGRRIQVRTNRIDNSMSEQLKYHVLENECEEIATLTFVREEAQGLEFSRLKHRLLLRIQTLTTAQ